MMPSGVKVYLASQPVDFRKGPDSLLSLVRDAGSDPFSGALYVFRPWPRRPVAADCCRATCHGDSVRRSSDPGPSPPGPADRT